MVDASLLVEGYRGHTGLMSDIIQRNRRETIRNEFHICKGIGAHLPRGGLRPMDRGGGNGRWETTGYEGRSPWIMNLAALKI
jgi:hypothetical protein